MKRVLKIFILAVVATIGASHVALADNQDVKRQSQIQPYFTCLIAEGPGTGQVVVKFVLYVGRNLDVSGTAYIQHPSIKDDVGITVSVTGKSTYPFSVGPAVKYNLQNSSPSPLGPAYFTAQLAAPQPINEDRGGATIWLDYQELIGNGTTANCI